MFREALSRDGEPGVYVQQHVAPEGCALDDRAAWRAANPGLDAGIVSEAHIEFQSREALAVPTNAAGFRALHLNQPVAPTVELLVDASTWEAVEAEPDALPAASGACWVGVDLGGSMSLSAVAVLWETGRLEAPNTPNLSLIHI